MVETRNVKSTWIIVKAERSAGATHGHAPPNPVIFFALRMHRA
jgi:hypothetical protein